jgi:hypothetical protein
MKGEYTFYNDTFEFDECLLHNINKTLNTCSKHIQKIYFLFTSFYLSWKGGRGQCIYFRSFTHIIEFLMNIWWQLILIRSQIIIWSYLCDQNWWNIIKKKIDTSFYQRSLISVFQIWFNVYLLTSYMTRFGLWICMSKSTHDFWLCNKLVYCDKMVWYAYGVLRHFQQYFSLYIVIYTYTEANIWFDFLCLTPLSAIFQLYHGERC